MLPRDSVWPRLPQNFGEPEGASNAKAQDGSLWADPGAPHKRPMAPRAHNFAPPEAPNHMGITDPSNDCWTSHSLYFAAPLNAAATKDDGATFFQAASIAGRRIATVATRSFTFVAPLRPHPPLTGMNTAGCARTNDCC